MSIGLMVSGGKEQVGPRRFKKGQYNKQKWQKSRDLGKFKAQDLWVIGFGKLCATGEGGAFSQTG